MVGVAGYHSPFHVIEIGLGVIGRAAATQTTQFIPNVLNDPDYRAARDDVRSEIAAPIVHDGELLGVVNFEGTLAHPMTTSHVALAELLARSIAASLRSAQLDEERRERLHAIGRVLEVSRGLVSDLDRSRTARAVVDAASDLLAAEHVLIAGRGADDTFIVEHETPPGDIGGRILGPDDAAASEAIATGEPNVTLDPDGRSTVALPIRIDGEVAAVLVAVRPTGAPAFGPVERGIADLLVTQVAVALRNADRHAEVSDAAVRDQLTGLLNRRYFDEAVETAFATARRSGTALSLIVLDLDRFSAVNNDHGHAVGDAVLRRVARAMAGAVRVGDTVARYGGEEFVVIAPGADTAEAVAVAERIRAAVAVASSVGADAHGVQVTVSAGVATLLGDELDGRDLFRAADSALLAAKRAGRDRVATL
jgi:diguanylate cyclase (GGDEF)-like protein